MKIITMQFFRLILPLIGIIIFFTTQENIFLGFSAGYFLCWVFSTSYMVNHMEEKE